HGADSLRIGRIKADLEKELPGWTAGLNKYCQSNITANFDWSFMPTDFADGDSELRPLSRCKDALEAIASICHDDTVGEGAVRAQINHVTCGMGPAMSIALKESALTYKMVLKSSEDHKYFVYAYLMENLRVADSSGDNLKTRYVKNKMDEA